MCDNHNGNTNCVRSMNHCGIMSVVSPEKSSRIMCANLADLVKKTLLAFCEINVTFTTRLEIRGSVHVQADGDDVASFLLDERCVRQPAAGDDKRSSDRSEQSVSTLRPDAEPKYKCVTPNTSRPFDWRPRKRRRTEQHDTEIGSDLGNELIERQSSCDVDTPVVIEDESDECTDFLPAGDGQEHPTNSVSDRDWSVHEGPANHVKSETVSSCIVNKASDVVDSELRPMATAAPTDSKDAAALNPSADYQVNEPMHVKREPTDDNFRTAQTFSDVGGVALDNIYQADYDLMDVGVSPVEARFACVLCSERFTTRIRLDVHMSHWHRQVPAVDGGGGGSDVRCLVCQSTFATSETLAQHAASCHFNCRLCSKFFSTKQARDSHFRADHQLVRYTCPVCCVRFKTKDGFRCHVNSQHSRSKPYDCAICQRRYYTRQGLYSHRKLNHCVPPSHNVLETAQVSGDK